MLYKHRTFITKGLAVSFLFSALTGIVILTCRGAGMGRIGISMQFVKTMHAVINVIFLFFALLHSIINWKALVCALKD